MQLPLAELRPLLESRDGLMQLVARRAEETDHVDFKLTVNHRNPDEKFETRADCAALATAGEGYLLVGVRETDDGRNESAEIVGIPKAHAVDLKKSIEDFLGNGIDPPIGTGQRTVWLVDVGADHVVLVVLLKGRFGYPKCVEMRDGNRFVVRQVGKKRWLTPAEERALRYDLEVKRPLKTLVAALLVFGLLLAATTHELWISPLRKQVSEEREVNQRLAKEHEILQHRVADQETVIQRQAGEQG